MLPAVTESENSFLFLVYLQGFVTALFGDIAGISDLSTVIDAVAFLAVAFFGDRQKFLRPESLQVIDTIIPVRTFRKVNDQQAVRAVRDPVRRLFTLCLGQIAGIGSR